MRSPRAHVTVVVGEPSTADELRRALTEHGVDHAAVVAHISSIRRSLVLGENDFVVVCIALDHPTLSRQGPALRSLLADHHCFPTAVRTVGMLTDLGFTREAAELGCDVYVKDSAQAAEAIRLLDDAWAAESSQPSPSSAEARPRHRWRIHGGWMHGSPELPAELTSLIPSSRSGCEKAHSESNPPARPLPPLAPRRIDRSGRDFGDRRGP
ncbi:MAG: hypothetical protein O6941_08110 [Planctomycetota bacterium]|nr:hypothetical protein [Planctomycetota bacterium]